MSEVGWMPKIREAWVLLLPVAAVAKDEPRALSLEPQDLRPKA